LTYYHFQFRPYQYQLRQPLITNHGIWQVREGIIVSLRDEQGKTAKGEIAPLPWFGSETMSEALAFCHQLKEKITKEQILAIPDSLPACQFGFESALINLEEQDAQETNLFLRYSYLLPSGKAALKQWRDILPKNEQTDPTFKWKIGVQSLKEEIAIFQQLIEALPPEAKLRLDANGGLSLPEAQEWLKITDKTGKVEFLEQPLPPQQFVETLALRNEYVTPLALDESVANLTQLANCYEQGWRGIFVIKPAIAGFPSGLKDFCMNYSLDVVFSSVLETNIGRQAVLKLAQQLGNRAHQNSSKSGLFCTTLPSRAVGFGVDHWLI
jgi:O-succinylbenzoate synthase